jgi:hypothetical protein
MINPLAAAFTALLLLAMPSSAGERAALVRADGLVVFLPDVGGPDTYGTYIVPNALGRESLDRFALLGNPLQINFLPASELPEGFSNMGETEKLDAFFQTELRHLSEAFEQKVELADVETSRSGGVEYRSGTLSFVDASGTRREIRLTARAAGVGILHAGYQPENPATIDKAKEMVDALLQSFDLVSRPLNSEELTRRSKEVTE